MSQARHLQLFSIQEAALRLMGQNQKLAELKAMPQYPAIQPMPGDKGPLDFLWRPGKARSPLARSHGDSRIVTIRTAPG